MLHGKTSNMELDAIFEKYLPQGKVLPCDTMVHMEERSTAAIGAAARRHKTVYLPIFTRNHWIVAIMCSKNKGSGQTTTSTFGVDMYDSAPSFAVTRDIVKMFAPFRRNYALTFAHTAPHQQRGSEDCGLFMALAFFVFELHMEDSITAAETLPRALRPLLAHILERPEKQRSSCTDLHAVLLRLFLAPSDDTRQHIVKTFLNRDRTKALQGGTRSPSKP